MTKIVTTLALLIGSLSVFAGTKDLKIMNTLLRAGVGSEQFMSQVHVGVDDAECSYSNISKKYDCNMSDISANGGQGAMIEMSGLKAKSVFNMLVAAGGTTDAGMGKSYVSVKSIRCTQAVKGVEEGSASKRTSCSIQNDVE